MKSSLAPPFDSPEARKAPAAAALVRWGWYSVAVSVVVAGLNGLVALASSSLAVTAELVHNSVDLLAALAVVAGIRIATRRSDRFPYGLYKAENLVAGLLACLVFATSFALAKNALLGEERHVAASAWMIAALVLGGAIPLVFSAFEMRVGRAAGSPALFADAREYRAHAWTAGLAIASLVSERSGVAIDRPAAAVIVLVIARTGWKLLRDALRVLLDASLDAASLARIRDVISEDVAVRELRWVTARNAGRYRFVEAGVALRVVNEAAARTATRRIEDAVRACVPQVERVLLHLEASTRDVVRYAVPLTASGAVSEHFGRAPAFAILTTGGADGAMEGPQIIQNPHASAERGKGIRVAEWLAAEKVDVVMTREVQRGPGPSHVFGEAGIEVRPISATTLAEVVALLELVGSR